MCTIIGFFFSRRIQSSPVPRGQKACSLRAPKIRKHDDIMDRLLKSHQEMHGCIMTQTQGRRTKEQLFFEHCVERIMELPPKVRSALQLQIMQLFHDVENGEAGLAMPVPLVPAARKSNCWAVAPASFSMQQESISITRPGPRLSVHHLPGCSPSTKPLGPSHVPSRNS